MAELFVSYSSLDRGPALELVDELRAKGYSVWIDKGGIAGAANWSSEIVEAINACSTVLLLLSPRSAQSDSVAREVHLAFEKKKTILPIVLEKAQLPTTFEYPLAGVQRVYYHDRGSIHHALARIYGSAIDATTLSSETPSEPDAYIRVAVLPFDDLSPQHDNQWFADGMMDELIGTLSSLKEVRTPSRSDVLHYRDRRAKGRDIARELGVRYLIEGAVRKAGDKIRINASVADVMSSEQLWSDKFDGTFEDVFAFQESVAKSVTEALQLHLAPREVAQIEARPTQNAKAYELYLKGRHEQYYVTKEGYLRALEYYEQAASLDSQFAQAHINIASTCCAYYREYSKDPKWLTRAEEHLASAHSISGENSKTLMVRGMLAWLRGDLEGAITTLKKSAEADDKNYNAFNLLGSIYMTKRNYAPAVEAFQTVVALVEDTMSYFNLLVALSSESSGPNLLKTAERALPTFDRHLLREPEDYNAAVSRAFVLLWAGKKDLAEESAKKLLSQVEHNGRLLFDLGCLFYDLGDHALFLDLIRRSVQSGYREIAQVQSLVEQAPGCQSELSQILAELETIIAQEQAGLPA